MADEMASGSRWLNIRNSALVISSGLDRSGHTKLPSRFLGCDWTTNLQRVKNSLRKCDGACWLV